MDFKSVSLWTALVTPFTEDNKVDYSSLEKLLRLQKDAGNGVLLLGSTGESLNLDLIDKKEILNFAIELNLDIPIMVGVGGINLNDTINWITYLNSLKIDCYLMVTPLYVKPGINGQFKWFKTLLDSATRPTMLYNIPSRTGIKLHPETVEKLQGHKNFWAIKDAGGTIEGFKQFKKVLKDIDLYSGDDALMPEFAKIGAKGLVSVASNSWPKETCRYVEQCMNSTLTDKEIKMWMECAEELFSTSNPIPVKVLLKETDVINTCELKLPLTQEDLNDTTSLLNADKQIKEWYKTKV